jgi:poly(A) polymerase
LAAIGGEDPETTLRLSRAEAKVLADIRALLVTPVTVAAAAHCHGARAATAMALLRAASGDIEALANLKDEIARGTAAKFPLRAADLVAAGMKPGPALGTALEAARTRWLDSGLSLDKAKLLDNARG